MIVNLLNVVQNEMVSSSLDKSFGRGEKAMFSLSRVFGSHVLQPRLPFLLRARSSRSTNYKGGGGSFPIGVFMLSC